MYAYPIRIDMLVMIRLYPVFSMEALYEALTLTLI